MGVFGSKIPKQLKESIVDDNIELTDNELNRLYAFYKLHILDTCKNPTGDYVPFLHMLTHCAEIEYNPLRRRLLWVFLCDTHDHYQYHLQLTNERMDIIMVGFHVYVKMLYILSAAASPDLKSYYLFRLYDWDGDGYISANDLQKVLSTILDKSAEDPSVKEIAMRVLQEGDFNASDSLGIDEFRELLDDIPEFATAFTLPVKALE